MEPRIAFKMSGFPSKIIKKAQLIKGAAYVGSGGKTPR
jgi:hypothetical protein